MYAYVLRCLRARYTDRARGPAARAAPGMARLLASLLLLAGLAAAADMIEPPTAAQLAIPRQQRFDLRQYGGKAGGEALNTAAFEAAVAAIKKAGGGELYVPPGVWLTTGFALTSHMSLFLEKGATILGARFLGSCASIVFLKSEEIGRWK